MPITNATTQKETDGTGLLVEYHLKRHIMALSTIDEMLPRAL